MNTANQTMTIVVTAILAAQLFSSSVLAHTGADVFEHYCKECHTGGPGSIQSDLQQIAIILKGGSIHSHHFKLTESEMNLVLEYFKSSKTD